MQLFDTVNRFYYDMALSELRLMNDNTLYPNITYNSLLYLDIISYRENCTASYLAEVLQISKSAVTVKVNELIKQGFVTKIQSETDRRVHYLSVTPAVKEIYEQYNIKLDQAAKKLQSRYDTAQIDLFCEMLDMIRDCCLNRHE